MPKYENFNNYLNIQKDFGHYTPKEDQLEDQLVRYELIRQTAQDFATIINQSTPACREQSLAFTKLEEAVMWANTAIARNE